MIQANPSISVKKQIIQKDRKFVKHYQMIHISACFLTSIIKLKQLQLVFISITPIEDYLFVLSFPAVYRFYAKMSSFDRQEIGPEQCSRAKYSSSITVK